MIHALSTYLFVEHHCTTALLDRIVRAGITNIEIFCARQHLDYRKKSQLSELAAWFRDSEGSLHSMHSPMYNDDVWGRSGPNSILKITETVKARRVPMLDEIKRVLEIAEQIPFKYLIQHFGTSDETEYDEAKIDAAFTSLEELSVFARQRGVEILLENIPNAFSSADRLLDFLGATHLDLGFCFDVGHAHIMEGVDNAYRLMQDRIRSTHLHDNDGKSDAHLFPGVPSGGSVDWAKTMSLLRSRPDQYPVLLELRAVEGMAAPLDAVREVFDTLESR